MTPAARRSFIWIAGTAVALTVLVTRLQLGFDLSAFFPKKTNLTHDVLIEQVRTGPASRLLVIGIGGAPTERVTDVARDVQLALSEDPAFISVSNGEFDEDSASVPPPIRDHYLVMRDLDFSREGLATAINARMRDLAFGGGAVLSDLIARDPYLVTVDVLQALAPAEMSGEPWISPDGMAVLLAETDAGAIDIASQAEAVNAVQAAFDAAAEEGLTLEITGVGAFSVELQETIRAEARLRSILASGALLLILFAIFRNLRLLLLAALPLATGFLAGLALVTLLFDTVHGITLAFGFTLLGVAVDYPLHLFSHARGNTGRNAIRRIWPTMRLGMISTIVAYLALAFSNSDGLAQLGLFTAGGVLVAGLATRTWLPYLLPAGTASARQAPSTVTSPQPGFAIAAAALGIAVLVAFPRGDGGIWDDNLSSLSPVASDRLAADQALRSAALTADLRYQLALNAASLEEVLQDSEALDALLEDAMAGGMLGGWQSITQVLPSERTQEARRRSVPDPDTLARNLVLAVADTPFRGDAFEPFLDSAETARSSPPLTVADLRASVLRSWLDSHLVPIGDRWVALVPLVEPDPAALAAFLAASQVEVQLIDFQATSAELMQDYRNTALRTICLAALVIVALLWWVRGNLHQTLWIALTVTASLATTIAVISVTHGSLTVIHMVAMLLVLGLGLDYSLFLSRSESAEERQATDRGVIACAASTTLAFAILAASTIPLLRFLGLTVAAGSLASFVLAWTGSRLRRPS